MKLHMFTHAAQNYICPLCLAVKGIESDQTMVKQADIFYRDESIMALVNSKFVGNNPGHVIIIPVAHYENLYQLPADTAAAIMNFSQQVAIALKELRQCDGVMIQQNNEPASGQHALHYHMHVFPRFESDIFAEASKNVRVSDPQERKKYAVPLRDYFRDFHLL